MSEIDPELRDKIIETHTLVKRMDLEHAEHKSNLNGRLKKMDARFDKHDERIEKGEHFRTKVIAYAAVVSIVGGFFVQLALLGFKKIL